MISIAVDSHSILSFPGITEFASVQEKQSELDRFLASVERSAFRMAEIATRNPDDALDIVQDTMIKLVVKYADKPVNEWRPLFYSILRSRITDFHRKKTVINRIFFWGNKDGEEDAEAVDTSLSDPVELILEQMTLENLLKALQALPARQQEAFLLRTWQGFSVTETSKIMKCAEGSVKTHLYRATNALKKAIG
ncbi:MAG: RNA polymerase sigma factor [Pseudomonadales bacterium]|nr:RNA polymerase sigma factor [Pseudomonadales bacterium]